MSLDYDIIQRFYEIQSRLTESTMSIHYTDQECVAALNSCVNLDAWNKLPGQVAERVERLMRQNRIRIVCFMGIHGFGLRVYDDMQRTTMVTDSDEATLSEKTGVASFSQGKVDLDGHWVRCPAELFNTKVETKKYIVASANGRQYYDGTGYTVPFNPTDVDVWGGRSVSKKFTDKLEAQAVAQDVNGVVLEAD